MAHRKYYPGDHVKDLTFDPSPVGIVIAPHSEKPDAYLVRLEGASTDVVIHARNLEQRT